MFETRVHGSVVMLVLLAKLLILRFSMISCMDDIFVASSWKQLMRALQPPSMTWHFY